MAKVTGGEKLVRQLRSVRKQYSAGLARGVRKAAAHILRRAQKLVPYLTGELEESGHLEERKKGGDVSVDIVFEKPYAIVQHENLDFEHPNGRQAKYLETPIREDKDLIQEIIRKEAKNK
jgi:hypothetical protein